MFKKILLNILELFEEDKTEFVCPSCGVRGNIYLGGYYGTSVCNSCGFCWSTKY